MRLLIRQEIRLIRDVGGSAGQTLGCRPNVNQVSWWLREAKGQEGLHVRACRNEWCLPDRTDKPLSLGRTYARSFGKDAKAGLCCLMIEFRATEIDELIRRNLLDADARNDHHAIRQALYRHLDNTLRAPT